MNLDRFENLSLVLFFFLLVFAVLFFRSIKILKSQERLLVFRMGKLLGLKGPGLVFLRPFTDFGYTINLSQLFPHIPPEMVSSFNYMVEPIDSLVSATEHQNVINIQGDLFLIRRY